MATSPAAGGPSRRVPWRYRIGRWRYDPSYRTKRRALAIVAVAALLILALAGLTRFVGIGTVSGKQAVRPSQQHSGGNAEVPGQYRASSVVVDVTSFKQSVDLLDPKSPRTVAVDAKTGKATYPVHVTVMDGAWHVGSGLWVTLDGKSVQTDGSGVATFQHEFSTKAPISSESKLQVAINRSKPTEVSVWVSRVQLNSVGPPALNPGEVVKASNTSQAFRDVLSKVLGVPADQLVITGLDVGIADGATPMLQLVNGVPQQGSTPPAGQPIWVVTYADRSGKTYKIFINPVCVNAFPSAPQPKPPVSSTPIPTPSAVPTPSPLPAPTPIPTPVPPTKNPGNVTANPPPPPPPNATPAPPSVPSPGTGSGTVTVSGFGCNAGSCSVSWSGDLSNRVKGWVVCNGALLGGFQYGQGPYTANFAYNTGNWPCRAYVGNGTVLISAPFTLTV